MMTSQTETSNFKEHFIQRNQYRIYVREYPGADPAIVLLHGFPDNLHLYDRLISHLSPPRRVIVFDFLGWGNSDKPNPYSYTATNQTGDLHAVITQLRLQKVVLVAHDASGPPAIDWALDHPDQISGLVLLNTYYCAMSSLRPPEAIWLFSTPLVRNVARPISRLFSNYIFRKMFWWQVGKFFRDSNVKNDFLPILYRQFDDEPSAQKAFFGLNKDLLHTVRTRTKMIPKLRDFPKPVRIIFGDADPYLNKEVGQSFHKLFPKSELFLLSGARHYVQMDEPKEVGRLILSMASS